MAQARIDIQPLRTFDPLTEPTSVGQRWKVWKRRFETYLAALGITDTTQQRALLLYQAGEETQEIFDTLPDTGEAKDYQKAMEKLDAYFTPKRNTDFEIFKFRTTVQLPDETVDQFATRLRKLGSTCAFDDIHRELKSVIIQNCSSKRLRRYALLETDLTLDKLLAKGRAFELSDIQATGIEEALSSTQISESVNFARTGRKPHPFTRKRNNASTASKSNACHNCGGVWPHKTTPCPARGKDCRKCGQLNHFAKHCRSSKPSTKSETVSKPTQPRHTVHHVANLPSSDTDDEEYLYTVNSEQQKTPKTCIKINNVYVNMVVDTGASIDIIDEPTFAALQKSARIKLQQSKTRIFAYGAANGLSVIGKFDATLESKAHLAVSTLHVVQGSHGCLLSYKTASALGLVTVHV